MFAGSKQRAARLRLAALLAITSASVALPASATAGPSSTSSATTSATLPESSAPSPSGSVTATGTCIGQRKPLLPVVKNGVSRAQQRLDFANLSDLSTGAGVSIGVIDSGVNPNPAFGSRLSQGGDYVAGQDQLIDCDGHGTIVAGIIAGSPDLATGFTGVAPQASILSYRQSSSMYQKADGKSVSTSETLVQAIEKAVKSQVKVINISIDSCSLVSSKPDSYNESVNEAVHNALVHNVVVVVAAGNLDSATCNVQNTEGKSPVTTAYPANSPGALTVAALNDDGAPESYSLAGPWVGVAAPGDNIISTNPQGRGEVSTLGQGSQGSPIMGTSFAAPYVTGLAALIRSRFPGLSAAQVIHRIEVTADHPGGGRNDAVGFGEINPRRALTASLPEEGSAGLPQPPTIPTSLASVKPRRNRDLAREISLAIFCGATLILVLALTGRSARQAARTRYETAPKRARAPRRRHKRPRS